MKQFYKWGKAEQPISDREVSEITGIPIGYFLFMISEGHLAENKDIVWPQEHRSDHEPIFWREI